jgi:hypothetical protein
MPEEVLAMRFALFLLFLAALAVWLVVTYYLASR